MSNLKKNQDYQNTSNSLSPISDSSNVILNKSDLNKSTYEEKRESLHYFICRIKEITNRYNKYLTSYKKLDILSISEYNVVSSEVENIYTNMLNFEIYVSNLSEEEFEYVTLINEFEKIIKNLTSLFKQFGCYSIDDFFFVEYNFFYNSKNDDPLFQSFLELIKENFHPIKITVNEWDKSNTGSEIGTKEFNKLSLISEEDLILYGKNFESIDLARIYQSFYLRVYGMRMIIHLEDYRETLVFEGIVDDNNLDVLDNNYILDKLSRIKDYIIEHSGSDEIYEDNIFLNSFCNSLSIKDLIVYSVQDINTKYIRFVVKSKRLNQEPVGDVVTEFCNDDLFSKRSKLINLLIKYDRVEYQFLAFLLYDLLSSDVTTSVETNEQNIIFESFPSTIKRYFKNAMKQTIDYTSKLCNYEINVPLEQQICLLKANDSIKQKAMIKLKEVKSKNDDSGTKARQWLEGLLKIPFGVYKEEPILKIYNQIKEYYDELVPDKDQSTNLLHIKKHIKQITSEAKNCSKIDLIKKLLLVPKRDKLKSSIILLNKFQKQLNIKNKFKTKKLCHSGKKIDFMINEINEFLNEVSKDDNIIDNIYSKLKLDTDNNKKTEIIDGIEEKCNIIDTEINNIDDILENSVHGHLNAKRQIKRIIGQWITGEKQGYCFGFEGPPGVGKCLAKGTSVMMSNGKIKKVEDINVGDTLMGDDSTKRNVLALGNGIEKMYKIKPVKGEEYVVNESHILSLKMTKSGKNGDKHQTINGVRYFKDDIVDICVTDYLKLPNYLKETLKGYRVPVKFNEQKIELDPYILGYWLGDGTSSKPEITTIEDSVLEYFKYYCIENNLELKPIGNTNISYRMSYGKKNIKGLKGTSGKNYILNMLKKYNVLNNKHVPDEYKYNSKQIQLELLAGFIDSDGSLTNGGYDIIQKNETLIDDIIFIARSLGFAAYKSECEKSCIYKGDKKTGTYYRTYIHGKGVEEIPVKVERKKTNLRKQIKNVLNTGIEVIPLENDEYYGFQIDGNSRFLLGDFTVTHNTSLAKKGLSNCLKDSNDESRPFGFIAIGGSNNASTLTGHNYTYVGSTWGRIVDILMETKCMNPIIFIDELDKVSQTEYGKEIISILTHLVYATQNDTFHDKYFSGIDIDLSKALFIFSYNDASLIDSILLDRIHRIKFQHLTLDDKLIIIRKHMLPELNKKIGIDNIIHFDDDVLKFIIEEYTCEPGVRKLKEILFEIISEINLSILQKNNYEIPIVITKEEIAKKYLKERHNVRPKKIHKEPEVGVICGLWANAMGQGGIIPIQTKYYLAPNLLELKLTGMQGDVMKESMTVAKTLAWSLCEKEVCCQNVKNYEETKCQGLHIHCPEGATPKDGPSAGTAITVAIHSLLNGYKIKNNIAITGEINLQGCVTAIGGLDLKILGGIKAGVIHFIFPKENLKDFDLFKEKYEDKIDLSEIKFTSVENIKEVLDLVYI